MKKFAKKNNKGFSLVELIVVVLIMAIIAVALSPQVLKWVENSRIATDASNYDAMVADLQIALTDKNAYAAIKGLTSTNKVTVTISSSDECKIEGKAGNTDSTNAAAYVIAALEKIQPDWEKCKAKVANQAYKIDIYDGCVIRTANAPSDLQEDAVTISTP